MTESRLAARSIRAPKTGELVAAQIRRQIVRGVLREGEALPSEAELMERYGVLAADAPRGVPRARVGRPDLHPPRRPWRRPVSQLPDVSVAGRHLGLLLQLRSTTLDDVFAARVVIEPAAARKVADLGSEIAVARLRGAIDAEETAAGDPATFAALSARFHSLLVSVSGNDTLAVLAEALAEIIVASTEHAVGAVEQAARPAAFEPARGQGPPQAARPDRGRRRRAGRTVLDHAHGGRAGPVRRPLRGDHRRRAAHLTR